MTKRQRHIFVAYSREDTPFVNHLAADLKEEDLDTWIDHFSLTPGTLDWETTLRNAIRASKALVLVATPASRQSRYVKDEIRIAEVYERPIFALWAKGEEWIESVPMGLGGMQFIDARDALYRDAVEQLTILLQPDQPLPPNVSHEDIHETKPILEKGFIPRNPYKGLKPFERKDAMDYFGREALTQKILERATQIILNPPRLLAIVGASGSGKSSLVMAGLLPALQEQAEAPLILPRVLPGEHPLENLAVSLAPTLGRSPVDVLSDLRRVVEETRVLPMLLQHLDKSAVLFVDQFEELFTLTKSDFERQQFIDLLMNAINDSRGCLTVIITLRADFYDRPLSYPELGALIDKCSEVVLPMETEEMRAAIEKPARLEDVRLEFDKDLVGDLLFDVRNRPGALPLLQFTLDQLYQRREGNVLTRNAYQAIGGVTGALSQHADQTLFALSQTEQDVARQLFLRLVTLGEATDDTRRRVPIDELLALVSDADLLQRVINKFSDARLITLDRVSIGEGNPVATVEIAHEALISQWSKLSGWLNASREDLLMQRRLHEAMREWNAHNRDVNFLVSGGRLAQFQEWADSSDITLTDREKLYLRESIDDELRKRKAEQERKAYEVKIARRAANFGRMATVLALVSFATLIILGLTFTSLGAIQTEATEVAGFVEMESARAESLRLSSIANGILQEEGDAQLAALLSLRGLRAFNTAQADDTLVRALPMMNRGIVFGGDISGIWTLELSPDRKLVALAGRDGITRVRDIATWTETLTLERHNDIVCGVTFSHDGRQILTASFDRTARLWDAQTGELIRILEGSTSEVCTVAFSNDDRRALTAGSESFARLWDLETGEVIQTYRGHTEGLYTAMFSPNERYVATGSVDTTARLYDAATGEFICTFTGHNATVFTIAFSADSKRLLTGSSDYSAKLWDVESCRQILSLHGHDGIVSSVNFSPDEGRLITGSVDRTVRIWNAETGDPITTLRGHRDNVFLVTFVDEHTVITGSIDGTLRQWNLVGGESPRIIQAHSDHVLALGVAADGNMAVSGDNNRGVNLIDLRSGQVLRTFRGHGASITSTALSPDGQRIISTSEDGTVQVWDVAQGSAIAKISVEDAPVYVVAFAPDGTHFYTSGGNPEIKIWDVATLTEVGALEGHTGNVYSIAFNRDGTRMLSSGDDHSIRIWDVASGTAISTLEVDYAAYPSEFLPIDESKALVGAGNDVVYLYNLDSQTIEGTFAGHTNSVLTLDVSPDGHLLATGGADNTVRIWDIASQRLLRTLRSHIEPVQVVSFTPDGKQVVSASDDFTIQIHDVDVADFMDYACAIVSRDFTALERERYGLSEQPTCPQFGAQTIAMLPTTTPLVNLNLPIWTPLPSPTPYAGPALLDSDILRIPVDATITVDGDLSDWSNEPFITVETGTQLSDDPAENGSFRFAVAADTDYLYIAATTPDQSIVTGEHGRDYWKEDSFEFYVNLTGNFLIDTYVSGIYQININALHLDNHEPQAETINGIDLTKYPVEAITFHTDDGWGFELRFPFGDLEPTPGSEIGFQMHLNGTSEGDRTVKLIWSSLDTADDSWEDPSAFGRIVFVVPDGS